MKGAESEVTARLKGMVGELDINSQIEASRVLNNLLKVQRAQKRIERYSFFLVLFLIILAAFSLASGESSNIQTISEIGMSINIPSDYYVFTRDMPTEDPALLLFGYTPLEINQILTEKNIYLDAVHASGTKEITVTMVGSSLADFDNYQDSTLLFMSASFLDDIQELGVVIDQYEVFHAKDATFIRFREHRSNNPEIQCIQYYTTINAQAVNILFNGDFSKEEEDSFEKMVFNISFSTETSAARQLFYENAEDFEYELLDNGTAKIIGYKGQQANIAIPAFIDGYDVREIGHMGDNSYITGIFIPACIVSVDDNPFSGLSALQQIEVQNGNLFFDSVEGVLYNQSGDRLICYPANRSNSQFTVPNNVKVIGKRSFRDCDNLMNIVLQDGLETIEEAAFETADTFSEIIIPQTVILIEGNPFEYAFGLERVSVDPANQYYSSIDGVLFDIKNQKLVCYPKIKNEVEYFIPEGTRIIGQSAFSWNVGTTKIHFPESLTEIQDSAFYYCSYFSFPDLTGHIKRIGDFAFSDCKAIERVTISTEIEYIGTRAFGNCDALMELTIENGIEEISQAEFIECRNLKTVIIPDSVKQIGDAAFRYCSSLVSVTIPPTVQNIGEKAFEYCPNLVVSLSPGSYAEKYCKQNGLTWIVADTENGEGWGMYTDVLTVGPSNNNTIVSFYSLPGWIKDDLSSKTWATEFAYTGEESTRMGFCFWDFVSDYGIDEDKRSTYQTDVFSERTDIIESMIQLISPISNPIINYINKSKPYFDVVNYSSTADEANRMILYIDNGCLYSFYFCSSNDETYQRREDEFITMALSFSVDSE